MAMITILLESKTKTRVKHMGRDDQTYENIINELIKERE